ncbi:sigma-70 family RNA polymerase sigma factor [Clostridium paridis]|uniref:Sigma-70 family RNA polymerase sigma factor n=1 Tax=Clostridium paridis TaxID=2803863 RepID=A0A937K381_9CLOT|nr:sigma-70 family RNA polymerase sigma factor [Clostridium paridis]MBL4932141.1 sigma-70 family RNA polymerase sigma factor [Clostridium paridis]
MNYDKIENLVLLAKLGEEQAKEELVKEFKPYILNLSKKTFINGFEFEDIKSECYRVLFNCIRLYNPEKHRFVAYATNGIRNSINFLIRSSIRKDKSDGPETLILDDNLENILSHDLGFVEDELFNVIFRAKLKEALNKLEYDELELITFVFFRKKSLMDYSRYKNTTYRKAVTKRNKILDKLRCLISKEEYHMYLN